MGPMGMSLASTSPLKPLDLRDLDQSDVDIRTPYIVYASYMCSCYRSSASASGSSSSTSSATSCTTSALGSTGPVDVLMIPSGTGIILSPYRRSISGIIADGLKTTR